MTDAPQRIKDKTILETQFGTFDESNMRFFKLLEELSGLGHKIENTNHPKEASDQKTEGGIQNEGYLLTFQLRLHEYNNYLLQLSDIIRKLEKIV
jgi:hypothetical protein